MKIINFSFKTRPSLSDDAARSLTASFLDGSTTPEQEKQLYGYYSGRRVASDLECYRPMFSWYDRLERQSQSDDSGRRRTRLIASAAAVAVLALVGAGLIIGSAASSGHLSDSRLYAGSYIIRDGQKITDVEAILPELHRADRYVDSTLTAINRTGIHENPEQTIINQAISHITDPDVKAMLLADLY